MLDHYYYYSVKENKPGMIFALWRTRTEFRFGTKTYYTPELYTKLDPSKFSFWELPWWSSG